MRLYRRAPPKQRAVLAVLVMNRNRPVGTDSLIAAASVSARRAIPAAEQLSRLGYDRVHHLAGGYAAWHRRTTPR